MARHRLVHKVNGVRWSQPITGNVVFSKFGELFRVDGTTVHDFKRPLAVGDFWEEDDE